MVVWGSLNVSHASETLGVVYWWARLDLNQEPTDYESAALTVELRAPPKV